MNKTSLFYGATTLGLLAILGVTTAGAQTGAVTQPEDSRPALMRHAGNKIGLHLGAGMGMGMGMHKGGGDLSLAEHAELLGTTLSDLKAKHESGMDHGGILAAYGLDKESMKARMVAKMEARLSSRLDELVEAGTITSAERITIEEGIVERKADMEARMTERKAAWESGERPAKDGGRFNRKGFGRPFGVPKGE